MKCKDQIIQKLVIWILVIPSSLFFLLFVAASLYSASELEPEPHQFDYAGLGFIMEKDTNYILGSGFVIGHPNRILTCAHVVDDRKTVMARLIKRRDYSLNQDIPKDAVPFLSILAEAEVEKVFLEHDIAILKPKDTEISTIQPHPIDVTRMKEQDDVWIVGWHMKNGNPESMLLSKSRIDKIGLVKNIPSYILTSMAKPGYSGSPVFNEQGKAVGMVVRGENYDEEKEFRETIAVQLGIVKDYLEEQSKSDNQLEDITP